MRLIQNQSNANLSFYLIIDKTFLLILSIQIFLVYKIQIETLVWILIKKENYKLVILFVNHIIMLIYIKKFLIS